MHRETTLIDIFYTRWIDDVFLSHIMPEPEGWPRKWKSGVWFAIGAMRNRIYFKLYLNLNCDSFLERWRRAGRVLSGLGRRECLRQLRVLLEYVFHNSWPWGIAMDVLPTCDLGRIQIYYHSGNVLDDWVDSWYRAIGVD